MRTAHARGRHSASPPTRAVEALPARSHAVIPPRDFTVAVERISTLCGRLIERTYRSATSSHLYRFWEPVLPGARYGDERLDGGVRWGAAATRRPPAGQVLGYDEQVEHELREQRRAVGKLRDYILELRLQDDGRGEGKRLMVIFEARGDVLLMSDPAVCAALAAAQRI